MARLLIIFVVLTTSISLLFGQPKDKEPTGIREKVIQHDIDPIYYQKGILNSRVELRKAPPHGVFNLLIGEKVKELSEGEIIEIIGQKTYPGFKGTHIWYRGLIPKTNIEEEDAMEIAEAHTEIWFYGGIEGKEQIIKLNENL